MLAKSKQFDIGNILHDENVQYIFSELLKSQQNFVSKIKVNYSFGVVFLFYNSNHTYCLFTQLCDASIRKIEKIKTKYFDICSLRIDSSTINSNLMRKSFSNVYLYMS